MKKSVIIFCLVISQVICYAQKSPVKRNTIYTEYCGQGFLNSLSFDRLYRTDKKIKTSFSGGITLVPLYKKWNLFVAAIPVSYNWIFGKKNHHLELGTGLTFYTSTSQTQLSDIALIRYTDSYIYFTSKIGYRFQRNEGGFFFRFTLTPSIGLIDVLGPLKYNGKIYSQESINFAPNAYGPFNDIVLNWYGLTPWAGFSFGYTLK